MPRFLKFSVLVISALLVGGAFARSTAPLAAEASGRSVAAIIHVGSVGPVAPVKEGRDNNDDDKDQQRVVTVMTRNMDEGTDFGPLLTATTFPGLLTAVATTYAEVQASNIPERATAVAREIRRSHPDLVGLQEATLWRTGPLSAPGPPSASHREL